MQQQYLVAFYIDVKWFKNKQQKTARKHNSAESNKQLKHRYLI